MNFIEKNPAEGKTALSFYARNVADHKMPKIEDPNKFEDLVKKVDGKNVTFKKGKWGNGIYVVWAGKNLYMTSPDFVGVGELTAVEKTPKAEKDPNAPKTPRKKRGATQEPTAEPSTGVFVESDGGRGESQRPKQKSDGSVRAIAIAAGLSYDDAFEVLKGFGRKNDKAFDLTDYLTNNPDSIPGFAAREVAPEQTKLEEFVRANPTGTYIVETAKSIGVVKDGKYHDLAFEGDANIEFAFVVFSNVRAGENETSKQEESTGETTTEATSPETPAETGETAESTEVGETPETESIEELEYVAEEAAA